MREGEALQEAYRAFQMLKEEAANQIEILKEENLNLIVKVARLEKEADRLWQENQQLQCDLITERLKADRLEKEKALLQ